MKQSSSADGLQGSIIVIKIGTSSLIRTDQQTMNLSNLARICETVRRLRDAGNHVVLVSSGAVGAGCQVLGIEQRPSSIAKKQALAAVGQVQLMRFYTEFFAALGLSCAQVLLTLDNLCKKSQYNNARNTFNELLAYGTVPIVNENDTVAVEELRFGDNDTLSAQVAALIGAHWLFLLTDVDCLYTSNPNIDPNAQRIHEVRNIAALQVDTATRGTQWGTGGMATKLTAARLATAAGTRMVICIASEPENIPKIIDGERIGTVFYPLQHSVRGRKRWILSVPVRGRLYVDDGAAVAVRDKYKSLFSAGIVEVEGEFNAQDAVSLCDVRTRTEFARGLINYSAQEVVRVKGKPSSTIAVELGYEGSEEIVHRDKIALLSTSCNGDEDDSTTASQSTSAAS